jgi:PEP-CTERM motif-containing protein
MRIITGLLGATALLASLSVVPVHATPVCQDHENEHGYACRGDDPPGSPISVPEPATALLLGAGAIGVGVARYRRKKKLAVTTPPTGSGPAPA